jgi:hypothetical protein
MLLEPVRVGFEKGDSRDDCDLEDRPNRATRIAFLNSLQEGSGDASAVSHFSRSDLPFDSASANRLGEQFESFQVLMGVGTLLGFRHTFISASRMRPETPSELIDKSNCA